MNESDLNRIIVSSINSIGLAHKISDEASNYVNTSKKPFDYFGITNSYIIYGESKFLKGYQSFNFNRIREHQLQALSKIHSNRIAMGLDIILPVVSLGIWEPHKFFHVYFFDINLILNLQAKGKNSLKKKDLLKLYKNSCYTIIQNKEIQGIERLNTIIVREI